MPIIHIEPIPSRASKGDLIDLVCSKGELDRRRIGRIELRGKMAVVEVPEGSTSRLVKLLDGANLGTGRVRVWAAPETGIAGSYGGSDEHFQRLGRLIALESQAESQETAARAQRMSGADAERAGESLVDLVIVDEFSGLGGRFLIRLVK